MALPADEREESVRDLACVLVVVGETVLVLALALALTRPVVEPEAMGPETDRIDVVDVVLVRTLLGPAVRS